MASSLDDLRNLLKIKNNSFYDNLTITFSGFNIKNNIALAIESLLYFHPEVKRNIVVFDDNSNDGTKEYLEKNGIRRITWSGKYNNHIKNYTEKYKGNLVHWNNIIVREIMEQVDTKYILINDGDVVFLEPFLHNYEQNINGVRAFVDVVPIGTDLPTFIQNKDKLKKYSKLLWNDWSGKFSDRVNRVHIYHGLLDLEYFKQVNILFDTIDDPSYVNLASPPNGQSILDGGVDFLLKIVENKIPIRCTNYSANYDSSPVHHFGWRSSFAKHSTYFDNSAYSIDGVEDNFAQGLNYQVSVNPRLKDILERFKHLKV